MKKKFLIQIRRRDGKFYVGYWDGTSGDPGKDFRCLGIVQTQQEAEDLVKRTINKFPWQYK